MNLFVEEREWVFVVGGEGWEKIKMKGWWLVIIKVEVFVVSSVNGGVDGE